MNVKSAWLYVGQAIGSATTEITVGKDRTAAGVARISLVASDTTTSPLPYGFRASRASGDAGATTLEHRGTGSLEIKTIDAAHIELYTGNTVRMEVLSGGDIAVRRDLRTGIDMGASDAKVIVGYGRDNDGDASIRLVSETSGTTGNAQIIRRTTCRTVHFEIINNRHGVIWSFLTNSLLADDHSMPGSDATMLW